MKRPTSRALPCLLLSLLPFASCLPGQAGTPMASISGVGLPPVITSAAFPAWKTRYEAFRVHENDGPRLHHYYVSTSGSDANTGTDPAHPWATLAKANTVLGTASTEVSLRYGDIWHEWRTIPYTGLTQGTQATTLYTISHGPTNEIYPGMSVTLTGGATETATVLSYNSSTGVVQVLGTGLAEHTTLNNGLNYAITATSAGTVTTLTFGTPPPAVAGGGVPGLGAGSMADIPGGDGYRQIGSYNAYVGTVTFTSLFGGTGRTALNLHVPSYLSVPSGVNGCEVDAYSDGIVGHTPSCPAPMLSAWGYNIPAGGYGSIPAYAWHLASTDNGDAGTSAQTYVNTYYSYGGNPVAYVGAFRQAGATGPDSGIRPVSSFAQCDATPGSWYGDAPNLRFYFHPMNPSAAPNASGILYESAGMNGTSGIYVGDCNGTKIAHVHVTGYGLCALGNKAINGYSIETDLGTPGNSLVLDAVETDYSSRHSIGNVSSGSGAIVTLNNCRVGWLTGDTGLVVNYNANGNQETLVVNPVYLAGMLGADEYSPYGSGLSAAGGGVGSFCHTQSTSYTFAWFLSDGAKNLPGQWQENGMDGPSGGTPAWMDLAKCRSFVINQTHSARQPTPMDAGPAQTMTQGGNASAAGVSFVGSGGGVPNTVYSGCVTESRLLAFTNDGNATYDGNDTGGLWINSIRRFSDLGAPPRLQTWGRYVTYTPGSTPPYAQYYNCAFEFQNCGPEANGFYETIAEGGMAPGNVVADNCIFSQTNPGPTEYFCPALGNTSAVQAGNAYAVFNPPSSAGAAAGFSFEPGAVELGPWASGRPDLASPLVGVPAALVGGTYRLEYDITESPRPTSLPTIGPYSNAPGALTLVALPVDHIGPDH